MQEFNPELLGFIEIKHKNEEHYRKYEKNSKQLEATLTEYHGLWTLDCIGQDYKFLPSFRNIYIKSHEFGKELLEAFGCFDI